MKARKKLFLNHSFPTPRDWCFNICKSKKNILSQNQALLLCFKALKKTHPSHSSESQLLHTAKTFLHLLQKLKRYTLTPQKLHESLVESDHFFQLFLKTFELYEALKTKHDVHDSEDAYLELFLHLQQKKELPFTTLCVDHFFKPSCALNLYLSLIRQHYPQVKIYLAWETFEQKHENLNTISQTLLENLLPNPEHTFQFETKVHFTPNTSLISVPHQHDEEQFVLHTLLGEENDFFHPPTVCLQENKSFEGNLAFHLSSLDVQSSFFPKTPSCFPPQVQNELEELLQAYADEQDISSFSHAIREHFRKSSLQQQWKDDFRTQTFQAEVSKSSFTFSVLEKILKELEITDKLFSLPNISSHFMLDLIFYLSEKNFSLSYQAFQNAGIMFKKYRQGNANSRDRLLITQCTENNISHSHQEHELFSRISFSNQDIQNIFHEKTELKNAAEKYLFLMWVTKVNEEIIFSFSEQNGEGKENQPSEFLAELSLPTQIATPYFLHPQWKENDFKEHLSLQVQLELERTLHIPEHLTYHGHIQNPALQKHLHHILESKPLRITALETFAECPFRFFLDSILKVKEKEEKDLLDFDPRHRGTLLHHLLETFYKSQTSARKLEEIQAELSAISATAFEEKNIPHSLLQELWETELIKTSSHLLNYELSKKSELEDALSPHLFEVPFGKDDQPFIVSLDGKLNIALTGRIDRVDISSAGNTIALVDYKSGREDKKLRSLIEEGKHLQLPLYAHAMKSLFPHYKTVALKIVSTQEPESENALILKELNKNQFGFSPRSRSLITEEIWDELLETSMNYSKKYLLEMYQGHFAPEHLEQCSHCPHQGVCRMR